MKILFATPCFGGQLTTGYFLSAIATRDLLHKHNVQHSFYTLSNESLIPRGRNKCANFMLENDFSHLFFIDADLSWKPEWALELIASEHPVIAGTYPKKAYPLRLNFNTHDNVGMIKLGETFEVKHAPTGFLKIDRKVFEDIEAPEYKHNNGYMKDFFPSGEHNGEYESEDWGFSRLCQEAGYKVMLNSKIICKHEGTHTFDFLNASKLHPHHTS